MILLGDERLKSNFLFFIQVKGLNKEPFNNVATFDHLNTKPDHYSDPHHKKLNVANTTFIWVYGWSHHDHDTVWIQIPGSLVFRRST